MYDLLDPRLEMEMNPDFTFPASNMPRIAPNFTYDVAPESETLTDERCIAATVRATPDSSMKEEFLHRAQMLVKGKSSENGNIDMAFLFTQGIPEQMKKGSLVRIDVNLVPVIRFLWQILPDASEEDKKIIEMMNDRLKVVAANESKTVQKRLSALSSRQQTWAQLAAKICGDAAIGAFKDAAPNQDLENLLTSLLSEIPISDLGYDGPLDVSSINLQVTATRAIAALAVHAAQGAPQAVARPATEAAPHMPEMDNATRRRILDSARAVADGNNAAATFNHILRLSAQNFRLQNQLTHTKLRAFYKQREMLEHIQECEDKNGLWQKVIPRILDDPQALLDFFNPSNAGHPASMTRPPGITPSMSSDSLSIGPFSDFCDLGGGPGPSVENSVAGDDDGTDNVNAIADTATNNGETTFGAAFDSEIANGFDTDGGAVADAWADGAETEA
ncbi:hypothetical protein LTS18_010503 [Coniosporium uncinatum]|uniref:Uncharacterized protein n=1 Tax=Coniosporium uncinatum TaxID=93489 RepID=A0ACC3DA24_9PEZI|nr:hypothetical protein LTS18_010503 [Coniosporium uncinatum]